MFPNGTEGVGEVTGNEDKLTHPSQVFRLGGESIAAILYTHVRLKGKIWLI